MFGALRRYFARRRFVVGARLTHFVAKDVRRDVEIVDASEVDQGFVRARIRTWNVLYVARGIAELPELGPPRRVAIADLWTWTP